VTYSVQNFDEKPVPDIYAKHGINAAFIFINYLGFFP